MAITPDTTIKLLKVPIEIDNLNQLTFSDADAQYTYFNTCEQLEEDSDNYSYQRKDSFIMFPAHIDDILEYNYCMYQNSNYSNKWFYAFITKMEYENEGCTKIYIETDVFQTWQFDIVYKASFIEREHVNDDIIGKNVLPEGLQLGEYITNKKSYRPTITPSTTTFDKCHYVVGVTEEFDTTTNTWSKVTGAQYDGTYYPFKYFAFDVSTDTSSLQYFINLYNSYAKESAIVCIFIIPSSFISVNTSLEPLGRTVIPSNSPFVLNINADHTSTDFSNTSLDGYTPKNNKLKTFPYSFLAVSNNAGSDVIYRFEDFYTISSNVKTLISSPSFKIKSTITPSGSARLIPLDYKGESENELEGLNMAKFPILGWQNDIYTNWLTQNGVNIGLSIAGSAISAAAGVATGNPVGVASGILGIANTLGEIYKESLLPPQAEGNLNAGDINTVSNRNMFTFEVRSIKEQQAKIIDQYFSMYGYKVNEVKTPNVTGRTYWNYVKTINCNIEGDIPQDDMQKIKDIFNSGVTFWHDTTKFLDYTQNNAIVVTP